MYQDERLRIVGNDIEFFVKFHKKSQSFTGLAAPAANLLFDWFKSVNYTIKFSRVSVQQLVN